MRQSALRILLATAHPHIPQIAGGAQSSTHELACELAARGHDVALLAGLTGEGWLGLRGRVLLKLTGAAAARDDTLGYPTYRAWFAWDAVDYVKSAFAPNVAFAQSGLPVRIARAFEAAGVPTAVYFRNVETDDLGGDPRDLKAARFIANSQFTAATYKVRYGVDSALVYPLVQPEKYRTETDRSHVVFINPHPLKGLDVALGVAAACPEIPFLFVEAWTARGDDRAALISRLAALPNVALLPRTRDMRTIYSRARVVLAPSRWEEAFGRIAAEAHVSGIPVIAALRGGLPEAVGEGGLLIDPSAPLGAWVEALRRVWNDSATYADLSAKALTHATRPALNRDTQIATLIAELQRTIDACEPALERVRA